MELIGVTCDKCGYYFFTKAETHSVKCDKCEHEWDLLALNYEITDEEMEILNDVFKEIDAHTKGAVEDKEIWKFLLDTFEKIKNI